MYKPLGYSRDNSCLCLCLNYNICLCTGSRKCRVNRQLLLYWALVTSHPARWQILKAISEFNLFIDICSSINVFCVSLSCGKLSKKTFYYQLFFHPGNVVSFLDILTRYGFAVLIRILPLVSWNSLGFCKSDPLCCCY